MKTALPLVLCLLLGSDTACDSALNTELQEDNVDERAFKALPVPKITKFFRKNEFTTALIGGIAGSSGGITTLQVKSEKSTEEIVREVGDLLVPIISAALMMIPVIGPLLGGLFSGIWSIATMFFGQPQESPMEKLVKELEKQFQKVYEEMHKMEAKIIAQTRKETDKKIGHLMATITHTELSRNKYICDKYALISDRVSDELKHRHSVSSVLQLEALMYLNDCDNFLKDTSGVFLHHAQFADVLWIPSVISALTRLSFLAEVVNYGPHLNLSEPFRLNFWREGKQETIDQLLFYREFVHKRAKIFNEIKIIKRERNFTAQEYEACKMQQQLFYIDRDVYPYGTPASTTFHGKDAHVKLQDLIKTNRSEHHVQVFYNGYRKYYDKSDKKELTDTHTTLINCFMGPVLARVPKERVAVRVTFLTNRSYELRLLYLGHRDCISAGCNVVKEYDDEIKLNVRMEGKTSIVVVATKGKPNTDVDRFTFPAESFQTQCIVNVNVKADQHQYKHELCFPIGDDLLTGLFVIESVALFAVLPENDEKHQDGKLSVQVDYESITTEEMAIVGFELIVVSHV